MSSHPEYQYLNIMKRILDEGTDRDDRTGVGTRAIFGTQMRFDLSEGFPLFTTKKVWFKGVAHELLWMLSGDTNIKYLNDNGVHIWDEWANEQGYLGNIYGKQWRRWEKPEHDSFGHYDPDYIDQIQQVINSLRSSPAGRRHIVSAWNVAELDSMALPPCHCFFQFFVSNGKLSCQLYQRSCDWFLGVPFNIASYALLTHMIAQVAGFEVGELIHVGGDVHLYSNHHEQVAEQLSRTPMDFPQIKLEPDIEIPRIDFYKYENFKLIGYKSHPAIKAQIAV